MKTILKISFLFLLFIAFSCSKDDAPTPEPIVQPEPEAVNQAPSIVSLIAPAADAKNVDIRPTFRWEAAIDPDGDQITYEIYADTTATPSTLISATAETSFEIEERLHLLENYNWIVKATDGRGGESESAIQNFETRTVITSNATTTPGFDKRILHSSTTFNNKIWVIGGLSLNSPSPLNDVWSSEDGIDWNLVTASADFAPRNGHKTFAFDNKLWLIGGFVNGVGNTKEVWNTDDGITWNLVSPEAGFSSNSLEDLVVFDGKMWVINGEVWFSEDGLVWSLAHDDFDLRGSTTVFQNKLWSIEENGTAIHVSEDGFEWTTLDTNISPIISSFNNMDNILLSYDDKLWILDGREQKIVFSKDGVSWKIAEENTAIPFLLFYTSVINDDKIWVIGGASGGTNNFQDDVWVIN